MPIHLEWSDFAIRILCALLAGALIGFDRGEHGHAAGLRTTMLVASAACLSMIQANVLLPTAGKPGDSFVVLDLMRLPLGILSGMGFIGAGAIVRRDNFVVGVTTAATLWFVTVIGLCFGGGQIALGLAGLGIGLAVLVGLRALEDRIKQDRQATLSVVMDSSGPNESEIRENLTDAGLKIRSCAWTYAPKALSTELSCDLRWRAKPHQSSAPDAVRALAAHPGVIRIAWTPQVR
jgi:putative Mg2+ transporter-C (MgtC) family protein